MASEVLVPSSPAEAVELFGDGAGTTVIGGGTVVVPELTHGRLDPGRVLLLAKAGLDGVSARRRHGHDRRRRLRRRRSSTSASTPLAACARNVADYEIRGQATVGGNLCVGGYERGAARRPAGLPARARRAGALRRRRRRDARSRSRTSSRDRGGRLVLDVSFERPGRVGAFAALEYPAHPRVHRARRDAARGRRAARRGSPRRASPGRASRLRVGRGDRRRIPRPPALRPSGTSRFADDALASAWYREQTLPVLVRRALTQLEESA